MPRPEAQSDLFSPSGLPQGFMYVENILSGPEETRLIQDLQPLPLKAFEFHGFVGRRRVISFGWRYDFAAGGLHKTAGIPAFLLPVRARVAQLASLAATDLEHVLITEYSAGASIGWHKDRPDFGDVMGVSLASSCTFRFRRRHGEKWHRASLQLAPRSAYVLRGAARSEWQHSIPAVDTLRYSITFRTLAKQKSGLQPDHESLVRP